MKITIESTTRIVDLVPVGAIVKARVWEGATESGIPIQCLIVRIAVPNGMDNSEFERELIEHRAPEMRQAFDLRHFID